MEIDTDAMLKHFNHMWEETPLNSKVVFFEILHINCCWKHPHVYNFVHSVGSGQVHQIRVVIQDSDHTRPISKFRQYQHTNLACYIQ